MKKIAFITGISSPLGKCIAQKLSESGYIIYGGTRKKTKDADLKFIKEIQLDLESDESCSRAIKLLSRETSHIDLLVNVAGNTLIGPALDLKSSDFIKILNSNAVGQFRLIKECYPYLKKAKGKIINITSLNGIVAFPNFAFYSASKFAFEALGTSLRYELAKDGVSVTNIAPGAIRSPQGLDSIMPHRSARDKFPILRFLMPFTTASQIANSVLSIAKSSFPPAHVYVGRDIQVITLLQKILPQTLWDRLMFFIWNK